MYHRHLATCKSTQTYLLDYLEDFLNRGPTGIVTTSRQTEGLSRGGEKSWDFFDQAVATSFILSPSTYPTATAVEVGILVSDFFKEYFKKDVFLKWPNDLIFKGRKCGGFIMKLVAQQTVCGLGLNLVENMASPSYKAGYLFDTAPYRSETMALKIYRYILDHRQEAHEIVRKFDQKCIHARTAVSLDDQRQRIKGIFKGINLKGGARLQTDEDERIFYCGHLLYERPLWIG